MRGVYQHPNRGRQLILFDGIQYGNITPTDVDMVVEYKDKATAFVEVKGVGVELPTGQRLLLERFVNRLRATGNDAIAIVAEHYEQDTTSDIHAKDCIVRYIYYPKTKRGTCEWRKTKNVMSVGELMDEFIGRYENAPT